MIKHQAFFEALADLRAKSPEWNSVFAGLSVLRIVDRVAANEDSTPPAEWRETFTTRTCVEEVSQGDPARAILLRILDRIMDRGAIDSDTGTNLISYGRSLDLAARWTLATDVFQSIPPMFSEREHPRLIIDAWTALGAVARSSGDWDVSKRGYARAEHLAESINDRAAALTVRVGLAGSEMIRGNLSQADAELDVILKEAERLRLETVTALALHNKAAIAHLKGDYRRAIHLAYHSLELSANPAARERLLADIAASYAGLGMREPARAGYSIVAITSPHQWVRWQATLNLMELSIHEGDEKSFDAYVEEMRSASLDARLKSYFLFFVAEGTRLFGRSGSEVLYDEARQFADSHNLHQIAFEIEAVMQNAPVPTAQPSGELAQVAEVLEHLRAEASS